MDVLKQLRTHDAVDELNVKDTYARVRPWGNCTVFGIIRRDDHLRPGNVGTFENGDLRVNFNIGPHDELENFEDFE